MKLKYMLKLNNKIKDEVIHQNIMRCVYLGTTSFCDDKKNNQQNVTFSLLHFCGPKRKVFMTLEVQWPAGLYTSVFMWMRDGASVAGAL